MESVGGNFRARPKNRAAGTTPVRATGGTNAWISIAAAAPQARRGRRSGIRSSRFRARRYTTKKYAAASGPIAAERRKGTPPGIRSRRRKRARRYTGADSPAAYLRRFNPGGDIPGSAKGVLQREGSAESPQEGVRLNTSFAPLGYPHRRKNGGHSEAGARRAGTPHGEPRTESRPPEATPQYELSRCRAGTPHSEARTEPRSRRRSRRGSPGTH